MPQSPPGQEIPTQQTIAQFKVFVLPHLLIGSRGTQPKLSLFVMFNHILKRLHMGCPWEELPIEKDKDGKPEIHYTRIYRAFRRFEAHGCMDAIFENSVLRLEHGGLLDISVINGDGTLQSRKRVVITSDTVAISI